ncbi:MAG TPA: PEPxxWA-CTERM sorting domain-containing protein [Caulobacteraceae bacterium]|nr:PEPxxWA-CTERM sorting domain-containing protein [Caulobacteraceae bacterium]
MSIAKLRAAVMAVALAVGLAGAGASQATIWKGTAYFTYYANQQVASVTYQYNDATHSFTVGTPHEIAALPGADGLLFAPGGKDLLVGGQGAGAVYKVNIATGTYTSASTGGQASYHLALSTDGKAVYTSGIYGCACGQPLVTIPLSNFGTANAPTLTSITGSDGQVTQLAFAGGKWFYTDSQPNCCGNVGVFTFGATDTTSSLANGLTAAHGIVYDPYSGMLDLFGGGYVDTINPTTDAVGTQLQINIPGVGSPNFDQGAPDGHGHALIAGSNGITFIDYRASGNILSPSYVTFVGGFNYIDDIAPLSGAGSRGGVPEPSTWAMLILGVAGIGGALRGRRRLAFA